MQWADFKKKWSRYQGKETSAYQGHFAASDDYESPEGIRHLEASLKQAGLETKFYVYPGTAHWFMEENRPDAYNPDAARLAWRRLVRFLQKKLG